MMFGETVNKFLMLSLQGLDLLLECHLNRLHHGCKLRDERGLVLPKSKSRAL